ncbi:MAG: hypothetical protein LBO72_06255 [Helicobacteraceae bacterium]|jgi:hypothetical protein|nr:hypothetical protein [Helicobacteraceae bacterium]
MSHNLDPKVKALVLEAVESFLDAGAHRAVVVEYAVKKDGSKTTKLSIAEDGVGHFLEQGFSENGLKSFVKTSKTAGARHGYVLFETARLGDALGAIARDLDNIEADLARKIGK